MCSAVAKPANGWCIDGLAGHVAEIVAKESGNILGENQHSMVVNRLKKRLIDLGGMSPDEYHQYLTANYQLESMHLVSILTTHHTFFFREFCHFEYILKNLASFVERVQARGENKLKVFSAACSRGQEVYSLAMFFEKHLKSYDGISYEILGTDIDPESVKVAQNGVYPYKEVKSIPQIYLSGNWQKGTGDIAEFARVKAHLKEKVQFDVLNLIDPQKALANEKFDIIFCRNVFIYFDQEKIFKIVENLKEHLVENGVLVTGLSESLKSLDIFMETHAPSVYSFDKVLTEASSEDELIDVSTSVSSETPPPKEVSLIPNPMKVLVVDDSSSVLKLIQKIFESDPEFEVVGTAKNGLEAQEFLKSNEVDAMTLDIHMPKMDGVEYLKNNFKEGHPHVVVVSSASREDVRYAQKTIEYGASDFVEKPSLNNIQERSEEIKNKLKMAFLNAGPESGPPTQIFEKNYEIKNCEKKCRIYFSSYSDLKKVSFTLGELKGDQPPIFLVFEGNNNYLDVIKEEIEKNSSVEVFENAKNIANNKVYICDFTKHFDEIEKYASDKKTNICVYGICSNKAKEKILNFTKVELFLEDVPGINADLVEVAADVFPWTSFAHLGTEFLSKD